MSERITAVSTADDESDATPPDKCRLFWRRFLEALGLADDRLRKARVITDERGLPSICLLAYSARSGETVDAVSPPPHGFSVADPIAIMSQNIYGKFSTRFGAVEQLGDKFTIQIKLDGRGILQVPIYGRAKATLWLEDKDNIWRKQIHANNTSILVEVWILDSFTPSAFPYDLFLTRGLVTKGFGLQRSLETPATSCLGFRGTRLKPCKPNKSHEEAAREHGRKTRMSVLEQDEQQRRRRENARRKTFRSDMSSQ